MKNPVRPSSCVTPAGTSNELDVQNEWEEDLLSIPQSGGEMSKRFVGGIIGCKYKTSSWHLNKFPDGSNIGSTV